MTAPDSLITEHGIESMLSVARECPKGCFVEFGVYKGGSAYHLAKLAQEQKRKIFLYDTFEGIPYKADVDHHTVGDFADTSYEEVCRLIPYAKVVKGLFPESLVKMPPVAFAHIDADQYESIKAAIEHLGPLMVKGGAMIFDDVWCLDGATQAFLESGLEYTKTTYGKPLVRF